eukprot:TRINITY_DN18643_c0_g1_i1.p1 TRINITY_DN18643_c0_g1~~TRINITY_DN18643_c0_g1_i1.p1  ORF type:complete len:197 (+),score=33.80 TRINITY_DN18643_c0_g1_i1:89-679(+)
MMWSNHHNFLILYCFFFFKQKTAYEMLRSLVGSEMCIRDRYQRRVRGKFCGKHEHAATTTRAWTGRRLRPTPRPAVPPSAPARRALLPPAASSSEALRPAESQSASHPELGVRGSAHPWRAVRASRSVVQLAAGCLLQPEEVQSMDVSTWRTKACGVWTRREWTDQLRTLSLIHISEPTRLLSISYAVFCLKKKKQ